MDEVVPHSQDEDSSAYHAQRERLERNEFFKECLAPLRCVLKVGDELLPMLTAGFRHCPARITCTPTANHASAESSESPSLGCDAPLLSCSVGAHSC